MPIALQLPGLISPLPFLGAFSLGVLFPLRCPWGNSLLFTFLGMFSAFHCSLKEFIFFIALRSVLSLLSTECAFIFIYFGVRSHFYCSLECSFLFTAPRKALSTPTLYTRRLRIWSSWAGLSSTSLGPLLKDCPVSLQRVCSQIVIYSCSGTLTLSHTSYWTVQCLT